MTWNPAVTYVKQSASGTVVPFSKRLLVIGTVALSDYGPGASAES